MNNIDNGLTTDELIMSAKSSLLINQPFLGLPAYKLKWVHDDSIPTACTDGLTVRWNSNFIKGLSKPEATFIAGHEVLHVILKHHLRTQKHHDPETANIAMDYVINAMLLNTIQSEKNRRNGKASMQMPEGGLYDAKYNGWSWEDVYDDLVKNKPDDADSSGEPESSDQSEKQSTPDNSSPNGQDGQDDSGQGNTVPADVGGCGVVVPPKDDKGSALSDAELDKMEADLDITIEQAMNVAKSRGLLDGQFANLAIENKKPQVNWYDLLRRCLAPLFPKSYTWNKINKTVYPMGVTMPAIKKDGVGDLVAWFDTSGSIITQTEASQFLAELQVIVDRIKPTSVTVGYFHTKVWHVDTFKHGQKFELPKKWQTGGTDFNCFINELKDRKLKPKCMIVFTDMECDFPKKINVPTIWCATTKKVAPWGKTIKVEV